MSIQNQDDVIAIDAGTGFVKCACSHMRATFPSVYATRRMSGWEDPRESTVEAVGHDAVRMRVYPDAVLVRPVLEGRVADGRAFGAMIREAARILGCQDRLASSLVVMGLPYAAASQRQELERLVKRSLGPKRVLVIPQSIGTLLSEDARTGIVMSIGQGTTELVLFEDLKPITGESIPQACDYLYDGLDYLEYGSKAPDKRRLDNLASILANQLALFKTRLARDYEVFLSGGGALVDGLCKLLQNKAGTAIRVARDPVYSNAQGLYKLATMVPSTGDPKGISHPQ